MLMHAMQTVLPANVTKRPVRTAGGIRLLTHSSARPAPSNYRQAQLLVRAVAALDGPTTSGRDGETDEELRRLWDSVETALLRVGKKGPTAPQGNSLRDLLQAHTLVKVKVNGIPDATEVGQQLAEFSQGALLQCKGNTLLFARPDAKPAELQQHAQVLERKNQLKSEARGIERGDPLQELDTVVRDRLVGLINTGVLQRNSLDAKALRALAELSPEVALQLLEPFTKAYLRNMRNPSAWVMAQCGHAKEQLAEGIPVSRAVAPVRRTPAPAPGPARRGGSARGGQQGLPRSSGGPRSGGGGRSFGGAGARSSAPGAASRGPPGRSRAGGSR